MTSNHDESPRNRATYDIDNDGSGVPIHAFSMAANGPLGQKALAVNRQAICHNLDQLRAGMTRLGAIIGQTDATETNEYPEMYDRTAAQLSTMAHKRDEYAQMMQVRGDAVDKVASAIAKYADAGPRRLLSVRDRHPQLGLMLLRLIPYFYGDPREMIEVYEEYRDLVSEDFHFLFTSVPATPAPSQNVDMLRSALDRADKENDSLQRQVMARDAEATASAADVLTERLAKERAEEKLKAEQTARLAAEIRLADSRDAAVKDKDKYLARCETMARELRLSTEIQTAHLNAKEKMGGDLELLQKKYAEGEEKIAQQDTTIQNLLAAENNSTGVLVSLKETIRGMRVEQASARTCHAQEVAELHLKANTELDESMSEVTRLGDLKRRLEHDHMRDLQVIEDNKSAASLTEQRISRLRESERAARKESLGHLSTIAELRLKSDSVKLDLDAAEDRLQIKTRYADEVVARLQQTREKSRSAEAQQHVQIDGYRTEVEDLKDRISMLTREVQQSKDGVATWKQKYEGAQQSAEASDAEKGQVQRRLDQASGQIVTMRLREAQLEQQVTGMQKSYAAERVGLSEQLRRARDDKTALETRADTLDRQLADVSKALEERGHEVDNLTGEVMRRCQDIEQLHDDLKTSKSEHRSLEARLDEAKASERRLQQAEVDLGNELQSERQRLTRRIGALEAQGEVDGVQSLRAMAAMHRFLGELCRVPVKDTHRLARQLEWYGEIEVGPLAPLTHECWTVLDSWPEDTAGIQTRATSDSEELVSLVFELFGAAATDTIVTWAVQEALRRMTVVVSTCVETRVHAQLWEVLADAFVASVTARPDHSFEMGLAFYQVMVVVGQRWPTVPQWDTARVHLEGFINSHEFQPVARMILGTAALTEGDDYHVFSEDLAVFAGKNTFVLIDLKNQTIRHLEKNRWITEDISTVIIQAPVENNIILLYSIEDYNWYLNKI